MESINARQDEATIDECRKDSIKDLFSNLFTHLASINANESGGNISSDEADKMRADAAEEFITGLAALDQAREVALRIMK